MERRRQWGRVLRAARARAAPLYRRLTRAAARLGRGLPYRQQAVPDLSTAVNDEAQLARLLAELEARRAQLARDGFALCQAVAKSARVRKARGPARQERLQRVADVVEPRDVSHGTIRKFERDRVVVRDAFSMHRIIVENSMLAQQGMRNLAWKLDNKDDAYRFADAIGLRRPRSDGRVYALSELRPPAGPVAIKPTSSTGSVGVYLHFREDRIFSMREQRYLGSWDAFMTDAAAKLAAGLAGRNYIRKDEWIVQELITRKDDPLALPRELKFCIFYGELVLVTEVIQRQEPDSTFSRRFCYWTGHATGIDTGRNQGLLVPGEGFTPEDRQRCIDISLKIPSPFIRIDVLRNDEFVFCEFTPRPGVFHDFSRPIDRLMGEAYRKAEHRLTGDLLAGKRFPEFTGVFGC